MHDSLYARAGGYFASRDVVAPAPVLDFTRMVGRAEYSAAVARAYAASPEGWLTPAELFYPHYSAAIARYVLAAHAAAGAARAKQ